MQDFFTKYKGYIIGITLGALGGFLYWRFIGCTSGTCPITSNWYSSAGYGALIGALLGNSKKKEKKENTEDIHS